MITTENHVKSRYAAAAKKPEAALCCPVDYDPKYLEAIPAEVIEKDYGCGDPSKHLNPGETVLDLGSGTGKICFIASQVVGSEGKVIGVDMTDDMLEVARRHQGPIGETIGFSNVHFVKGRIHDLALDLEALDERLRAENLTGLEGYLRSEEIADELRKTTPLIASGSIDVVVSNCVLNLVDESLKKTMFDEIFRVLRRGGRAVISDIVSDEEVPEAMRMDEHLWSGCISGAFSEAGFLKAFEDAGFHGIQILERDTDPWQTVDGIEFRSVTVEAYTGKAGPCYERNQAVIYKGPFKKVLDDDHHAMERGLRYAVCDKTYQLYRNEPYANHFEFVEPRIPIDLESAAAFDCSRSVLRDSRETKGQEYNATTESKSCGEGECC